MRYGLIGISLLLILSFIPSTLSAITITPANKFGGSTSGAYINFDSTHIFDSVERISGYWYFNGKGLLIKNANVTITNWLTSEWINYTVTGAGEQRFYYFNEPSTVYLNGASKTLGDGWNFLSNTIIITGATTTAAITWSESIPESPPPPPYSEPETYFLNPAQAASDQIIYTATPFDLIITDELSIQNDQEFVSFTVESGLLNGSGTNLDVDTSAGHLTFHAEDSCTLAMELVSDREISLNVNNCEIVGSESNPDLFTITILSGSDVEISWGYNLESYADKYTVLAFGIVGIAMMIFGPSWAIRKILNDGLETETVERVGYAIIITMIGLGLFITFLYW